MPERIFHEIKAELQRLEQSNGADLTPLKQHLGRLENYVELELEPPEEYAQERYRAFWRQELEKYKADLQRQELRFHAALRASENHFQAVNNAGAEALKYNVLINGGAAVALLAFMGNLWALTGAALPQGILAGLAAFAAGVLLATLGYGGRYLSQHFYASAAQGLSSSRRTRTSGDLFRLASVTLALGGYGAFCIGVVFCLSAFGIPLNSP